ncbi:aminoglycoside phosphotransferase [Fusarium phyllophilum]|uniref:Aminoglycoside phosphotransferase n=1 Tax=Fusarium phyllophilum TaxID=47803 RepID=A0A8H5NNC5_9HYPO|nr:aminoglycoside phosphotransferase [Fusarium phyllophilum]
MPSNAGKVNGVIQSNEPLPLTVDELTKRWFTQILNKPVKDVEVIEIIHGTASKVSIKLTFQTDTDDSTSIVCVKGESIPTFENLCLSSTPFTNSKLSSTTTLPQSSRSPSHPVSYAGTDTVNGQGIVVMADLKAQGYTFGNPLETWTVDRARTNVEQLATLHASTLGNTSEAISIKDAILSLLAPDEWDKRFAPDARPPVPEFMENRERMMATFKALWESDSKMKCIVHGDAHIGNTFMTPAGEPWLS